MWLASGTRGMQQRCCVIAGIVVANPGVNLTFVELDQLPVLHHLDRFYKISQKWSTGDTSTKAAGCTVSQRALIEDRTARQEIKL